MAETIVLTGIARSKGKAAGEALVNRQRMGWAFNHVSNGRYRRVHTDGALGLLEQAA